MARNYNNICLKKDLPLNIAMDIKDFPLPSRNPVVAADGHPIPLLYWPASGQARALVHLCHGMGEHAGRYEELALKLNLAGYHVYAHDHRGHGPATSPADLGHYADDDGWHKVTSDVVAVQQHIAALHPDLPRYLFGHSMGSFIAQGALVRHPGELNLAGLILCGSTRDPLLKVRAMQSLVGLEKRLVGSRAPSRLMGTLTFKAFSRKVKGRTTEFDWLSHDAEAVAAYMADPCCGFDCSTSLWEDLAGGLAELQAKGALERIPAELPILIMGGAEDPVSDCGKGLKRLAAAYTRSHHTQVTLALLPSMRHEPLNETRRDEVHNLVVDWLTHH